QPAGSPSGGILPENLAYIIYTSGSTGRPKGVMITHANLGHYVQALRTLLQNSEKIRYLHTASIAFSSSVRQFLLPLTHGATLVIAGFDDVKDPLALFKLIKERGVTCIDLVPSAWRNCMEMLAASEPASVAALLDNDLNLVLSASEELWSDLPHRWAGEFKHKARLVNMLGQTETSGIVSVFPIPPGNGLELKIVPVGRPIAGTRFYLLDSHMNPVPVGATGELYIGGGGLGRGYLKQPGLTAERFVSDPFTGRPGARLYSTGDLCRFQNEGNLEFLGRADQQVKIRGFRIELEEIGLALKRTGLVREAAVIMREEALGNKQLTAYIVMMEGQKATIS